MSPPRRAPCAKEGGELKLKNRKGRPSKTLPGGALRKECSTKSRERDRKSRTNVKLVVLHGEKKLGGKK